MVWDAGAEPEFEHGEAEEDIIVPNTSHKNIVSKFEFI